MLGTLEYEGDADTLLTDSVVTGLRLPGATASFAVRKVDVEGASARWPLMHRVMCPDGVHVYSSPGDREARVWSVAAEW